MSKYDKFLLLRFLVLIIKMEENITVKNKVLFFLTTFLCAMGLVGCGGNSELKSFKKEIDTFCVNISELDTSINSIDTETGTSSQELLERLDDLDEEFKKLAEIDFPEEFDYLEHLSDEASNYMTEAVSSYHEAFSNSSYNEYTAEYAHENYARAYKRVQIIISFLHGEQPEDSNVTITY